MQNFGGCQTEKYRVNTVPMRLLKLMKYDGRICNRCISTYEKKTLTSARASLYLASFLEVTSVKKYTHNRLGRKLEFPVGVQNL